MKYECDLILDVLPLYQEGLASAATTKAVKEHLAECAACRAEAEQMKREAPDVQRAALPVKKISSGIKKRRMLSVLLAVFLLLSLVLAVGSRITEITYVPYKEGDLNVKRVGDQLIVSNKRPDVLISMAGRPDPDYPDVYRIEVETYQMRAQLFAGANVITFEEYPDPDKQQDTDTAVDMGDAFGVGLDEDAYPSQIVVKLDPDKEVSVYLANPGQQAVLLYGRNLYEDGGYMVLPRLALTFYFKAASALAAVFAVLLFILRKNARAKAVLIHLLGMPLAYLLAHMMVKGFTGVSIASLMRDLAWILACAACLYAAFVICLRLRTMRKEGAFHSA